MDISSCGSLLFVIALILSSSNAQQLELAFSEDDYSTQEAPRSTITADITKSGQSNEAVTVRVIPMTFDQYRSRFGRPPFQNLNSIDPAEASDFNNEAKVLTFPAGGGSYDMSVSIEIYDDNIRENEEAFLLYMESVNTQQMVITKNVSLARIRPDRDYVTIRFGGDAIEQTVIPEAAGFLNDSLYIIKDGETEQPLSVQLTVSDFGATKGVDYNVSDTFVLQPGDERVAVPITIFDDVLPEQQEYFKLHIASSPDFRPRSPRSVFLSIMDNDPLPVGFVNQTSVTVQEGHSMELCVDILMAGQTARRIDLDVLTVPGNATGGYELLDSRGRNATTVYLRLTDDQQMSCVQVIAVDDAKLEWPRNFTVKIEDIGANSLNIISPNEITVVITDNDGTPNAPENVTYALVNDGKDLRIEWTVKRDVLRPIESYYIYLSAADKTRRQVETDRSNFTTQETYYIIPNIDHGKQFTLQVCSQNEFGFNCSTPIPLDLTITVPTEPLEQPPTGLAPGIIAVIVILLLVCCLLLLVLILWLFRRRDKGESYSPREEEERNSQDILNHAYSESSVESDSITYIDA